LISSNGSCLRLVIYTRWRALYGIIVECTIELKFTQAPDING